MKLRYYLRGLGIGMLVTALVLILSGNTGAGMSDEAVKQRAAQLGMVEKDKSVLEDMRGGEASAEDTDREAASVSGDAEDSMVSGEGEAAEQTDEAGSGQDEEAVSVPGGEAADVQENEQTPVQSEEQALAEEIEQRAEEVAERGKEVAENSVPVEIVTFTVQQGDTSISVARRAQEMGLVESAADFDVFLCQNGYERRIAIGSYEITVGMTEKEIADLLSKSARG